MYCAFYASAEFNTFRKQIGKGVSVNVKPRILGLFNSKNFRNSKKIGNIAFMRGATTLFADILLENKPSALAEKQRQGRSEVLISRRNEALIDRFFYYAKIFHYNYEYVLELLSAEFFISPVTIPKIMEKPNNVLYLRRLKQEVPTPAMLRKKWPHMAWAA